MDNELETMSKKQLQIILVIFPEFAWRECEDPRNIPSRIEQALSRLQARSFTGSINTPYNRPISIQYNLKGSRMDIFQNVPALRSSQKKL
jgi:hypothetical protein